MTIATLVKLPAPPGTDDHLFRDIFSGKMWRYLLQGKDLPNRVKPGGNMLAFISNGAWEAVR